MAAGPLDPSRLLSTGSTLLNLACTGRIEGGFVPGHYYFLVGDSDSGKTFLALTCFAEATINPTFGNYRLIYDGTEGGAMMDIARFFGRRVADRMEPPAREKDGTPRNSLTIQDFYFNVDDALEVGRPFIYVLDSQDCLSSKEEIAKFAENKQAARKARKPGAKEPAGSYGDSKAKWHSSSLRKILGPLAKSGSILIIINQTRDSFDLFEKSSYSGGRALLFYATLQLWSRPGGKIKRTVQGKERQLGIRSKVRVRKNRITGRDRTVEIPIFHSVGIDDIGGCVDWLVEEKVWEESSGVITTIGIGPPMELRREALVRAIQEHGLEQDLKELVGAKWEGIERACEVRRLSRYL